MSRAANYGPRAALYAGGGFGGVPCHAVPAIVRHAHQPSGKSELREQPARFSKLLRISCERASTRSQGEGGSHAAAPTHEDEEGSFTPCHQGAPPAAVSAPGNSRPSISIQHLSWLSPGTVRWRAPHRPAMPLAHTCGSLQVLCRCASRQCHRSSVPCWEYACLLSPHLYVLAIHPAEGIK